MISDALVIVPAYNEARVIEETLAELFRFAGNVLVVDDGSSDDTSRKAKQAGAIVIRHCATLGYGAALKTGFEFALHRSGAKYLMTFDADGQHDPAFLGSLLAPLRAGEADYITGSRFLSGKDSSAPFARRVGSGIFAAAAGALIGQKITDPTTGLLAMDIGLARVFTSKFFPFDYPDADVLIMLHRMGYRIKEVPVAMRPSRRAGSMHAGVIRPAYYLVKMSVSMLHFALRADLLEKRREMESVI
jgi:glycosyltransferase involved in cell wall biosynthesis